MSDERDKDPNWTLDQWSDPLLTADDVPLDQHIFAEVDGVRTDITPKPFDAISADGGWADTGPVRFYGGETYALGGWSLSGLPKWHALLNWFLRPTGWQALLYRRS